MGSGSEPGPGPARHGPESEESEPGPWVVPRVVDKPWGREIWWAETQAYLGKILEVRAGHKLSLQYHREKLETLHFCRGEGRLTLAGREFPIRPGLSVTIAPGVPHRIAADTDLLVLEASTAHPADVVRLDDVYGRRDT